MQGPPIRSHLEFIYSFGHAAWLVGSLIKPGPLAVKVPSPNHWTAKELSILEFQMQFCDTPGPVRKLSPRVSPRAPTKLGRVRRGAHLSTCCPGSSSRQHKVGAGGGCRQGAAPAGPAPAAPPPYSLGLMDSRGTVMLARESSVGVGCCGGPGGSGDTEWSRPAALELGKLQLLLFCRSRSVSRGAGCCFSLIGGTVHRVVSLQWPDDEGHRNG